MTSFHFISFFPFLLCCPLYFFYLLILSKTPLFIHSSTFPLSFHRGFKSDEGYLCWSLPLSDFVELVGRKAFQILQANTNAILSSLETLGKDPSDSLDAETRALLKVLNNLAIYLSMSLHHSLYHFHTIFYISFTSSSSSALRIRANPHTRDSIWMLPAMARRNSS